MSAANRLSATTGGAPQRRTFSTCRARFGNPSTAPSAPPPCARSAFSVTIITATDGTWPHIGITMSKNFSAPRSAAKPVSLTT